MFRDSLDLRLFLSFFFLIFIGIIMVYSASAYTAPNHFFYLEKQLQWVFIGLFALVVAYAFPYDKLRGYTFFPLLISLVILAYLVIAKTRWITIGPIHFQGVDVAKLSLIFYLADSLSRKEKFLKSFSEGLFPHLFYIALFASLVVLQPDFSSAAMLVVVCFAMLFVSPVKFSHFALTVFAMLPAMAIIILRSHYKLQRLLTFLNPESDLQGRGYQVYHSLISLGSGGILGNGFAESHEKMFYLPEAHTDFIFSIIGEEWGFIGTGLIIFLFVVILFRGAKIAYYARDRFSFYLAVGITAHFSVYAMVHMMVTLGLLPPTGLPLPFISYGGTAMLFSCIYAGLLLNIARNTFSKTSVRQHQFTERAVHNFNVRKLKYIR